MPRGCERFLPLFALLLVLAAVLCGAPALTAEAGADPARVGEAREALAASVRSLGLQAELPRAGEALRRPEPRLQPENLELPGLSGFFADFARILLWVAILVIVVVILLNLRDNVWSSSRSRRLRREEEEAAAKGAAARMDKSQGQADDLARQGSFAEAMHMLLLQSVVELRRRLDMPIAVSLTSREIARRVRLSSQGHEAFADMVGRVEISYFGAHEPGEEEYLACRRSYEILSRALSGQGTA